MQKSDTRKLVCAACKYENEIERVYCHNCGEKLDRSLLPKVDELKAGDDQAKNQKQIKKMMTPNRGSWLRSVRTFASVVLLGAVVAAGFLALQTPENPPPAKMDRMPENEARDVWFKMMETKPAVTVSFKEYDINYYLGRAVKATEGLLGIKFERAFVNFHPGTVTVTAQRDAWGLPLYSSIKFKPVLENGKWNSQVAGVYFGKLGVHPSLGKLAPLTLDALAKVFEKEIKQSGRLASITPGEGQVTLVTKPGQ